MSLNLYLRGILISSCIFFEMISLHLQEVFHEIRPGLKQVKKISENVLHNGFHNLSTLDV